MDFILVLLLLITLLLLLILVDINKSSYNLIRRNVLLGISILCLLLGIIIIVSICLQKITTKPTKTNKLIKNKDLFTNQNGGKFKVSKKDRLKEKCGLPTNYDRTNHCFNDNTHHTCCMIGSKTRTQADLTGNPIGKEAKKAYMVKHNLTENSFNELEKKGDLKIPWCTCFGSSVCSQYSKEYKDTNIKFINNPNSTSDIVTNVYNKCEGYFRDKFYVSKHLTPGVKKNKIVYNSKMKELCENQSKYGKV
tara:strand:+ start:4804 stop:5553 length:750 start_codon:yes stop_codon:yes gene_type:complete